MKIRDTGRLETWDRFFDYLINTFYYRFRQQLGYPFGSFQSEPAVRFGGFVLEEPWIDETSKSRVRCGWHDREPFCRMGNLTVYNRYIYLNRLFLYQQLSLQVYWLDTQEFTELFSLTNLAQVLAHEIGHTILTDTNPVSQEINGGHGNEHDQISQEILKLIKTSSEWKELKTCWK